MKTDSERTETPAVAVAVQRVVRPLFCDACGKQRPRWPDGCGIDNSQSKRERCTCACGGVPVSHWAHYKPNRPNGSSSPTAGGGSGGAERKT